MILPIYLYGQPVLREVAKDISADYPNLKELIANMFETMYNADGVGLAAPQIGLDIRLIVIDLTPLKDEYEDTGDFRRVLINPRILDYSENLVSLQEGCLSLPGIHEAVNRPDRIRIKYYDENFVEQDETLEGFQARCVQHEYDHIEGKLFIDKISPIRKQLIKSKLNNLLKGKTNCSYRVKPVKK